MVPRDPPSVNIPKGPWMLNSNTVTLIMTYFIISFSVSSPEIELYCDSWINFIETTGCQLRIDSKLFAVSYFFYKRSHVLFDDAHEESRHHFAYSILERERERIILLQLQKTECKRFKTSDESAQ